jgi:WD40 repeat protein
VLTCGGESSNRKAAAWVWELKRAEPFKILEHDGGMTGFHMGGKFIQGAVTRAYFNRDSTRALTSSKDGTARLWEVPTGRLIRRLNHDAPLEDAQFNHDESRVLTWSTNGAVRLSTLDERDPVRNLFHDGRPSSVLNWARLGHDETLILTWRDQVARVWRLTGSDSVWLQEFNHDDEVNGATFDGGSSRVLTWSADGTVRLWDVEKAAAIRVFRPSADPCPSKYHCLVRGARFIEAKSRVLAWSADGKARLWDYSDPRSVLSPEQRVLEAVVGRGRHHPSGQGGPFGVFDLNGLVQKAIIPFVSERRHLVWQSLATVNAALPSPVPSTTVAREIRR